MNITLNNETISLPKDNMTVADLIEWRRLGNRNMAFVINGKLIRKDRYEITRLNNGDFAITVSAAFGG